jgi:hypothetical protein
MSTYGDLKTTILDALGNPSNMDSIIMALFNSAQDYVAKLRDWPDLEKTAIVSIGSTSHFSYDLSTAPFNLTRWKRIASVKMRKQELSSGYPFTNLRYLTPEQYDKEVYPHMSDTMSTERIATYYSIWGNAIWFDYMAPTPAISGYPSQVWLNYYQFPTPITGDSTTVQYKNMDMILCALTIAFAWLSREERDSAKSWFDVAGVLLKTYGVDTLPVPGTHVQKFKDTSPSGEYWTNPFKSEMP